MFKWLQTEKISVFKTSLFKKSHQEGSNRNTFRKKQNTHVAKINSFKRYTFIYWIHLHHHS
jgi:hypothetical protein